MSAKILEKGGPKSKKGVLFFRRAAAIFFENGRAERRFRVAGRAPRGVAAGCQNLKIFAPAAGLGRVATNFRLSSHAFFESKHYHTAGNQNFGRLNRITLWRRPALTLGRPPALVLCPALVPTRHQCLSGRASPLTPTSASWPAIFIQYRVCQNLAKS